MTNAKHSSKTDEWGTPARILEAAREVLGGIDLDPASDRDWNQTVQARHYFTKEDDGLKQDWPRGSVWCNPPSGRVGSVAKPQLFWEKLMDHREKGDLKHAIFLAFSVEQLQTTQRRGGPSMMLFPLCIPDRRLYFVSRDGVKKSPTHASALVYVPGGVDKTDDFLSLFSQFGCFKR